MSLERGNAASEMRGPSSNRTLHLLAAAEEVDSLSVVNH